MKEFEKKSKNKNGRKVPRGGDDKEVWMYKRVMSEFIMNFM